MKEDASVTGVGEDSRGSFNELGSSDDIDKEPDGCGVMLGEAFVDVFRILNVKARLFDKGLVLYFL
jgi:hypothetical protein